MRMWIRRAMWMVIGSGLLASQAGCDLNLEDAFAAGVYDFVSGSVTEALVALSPLSLILEAMGGGG